MVCLADEAFRGIRNRHDNLSPVACNSPHSSCRDVSQIVQVGTIAILHIDRLQVFEQVQLLRLTTDVCPLRDRKVGGFHLLAALLRSRWKVWRRPDCRRVGKNETHLMNMLRRKAVGESSTELPKTRRDVQSAALQSQVLDESSRLDVLDILRHAFVVIILTGVFAALALALLPAVRPPHRPCASPSWFESDTLAKQGVRLGDRLAMVSRT